MGYELSWYELSWGTSCLTFLRDDDDDEEEEEEEEEEFILEKCMCWQGSGEEVSG